MKKSVWITITLLIGSFLICGCNPAQNTPPEPSAAQVVITETNTAIPTSHPTNTETLAPTITPTITATIVPTLNFYSINPTIEATAENCEKIPSTMCVPGIEINLSGRKLSAYEVTMSYPGAEETTFSCPQQALLVSFGENMAPVMCNEYQIFFMSVGLPEMTISINWDEGSLTQTVFPEFEIVTPQGISCEPHCSIGTTEIKIP